MLLRNVYHIIDELLRDNGITSESTLQFHYKTNIYVKKLNSLHFPFKLEDERCFKIFRFKKFIEISTNIVKNKNS